MNAHENLADAEPLVAVQQVLDIVERARQDAWVRSASNDVHTWLNRITREVGELKKVTK